MSIKIPYIILICLLGYSISSANTLLEENWESGNTNQWNSFGDPLPSLNSTSNALGTYSLEPNGDFNYHSGLVSNQMFSLTSNTRLTVDAYIESAVAWSELEFGLVNTNILPDNKMPGYDPDNTSNTNYTVATLLIDADTQDSGYKFVGNFVGDNGSQRIFENDLVSNYFDDWHSFTFDFQEDGSIAISIDDQSVFTSNSGLFDYNSASDFAVMLAGRSYDGTDPVSSSENLYDNISLISVPEFAHFNLVLSTTIFFALILSRGRFKKNR